MTENTSEYNRRQVLRHTGASAIIISTGTGLSSAKKRSDESRLVEGIITYEKKSTAENIDELQTSVPCPNGSYVVDDQTVTVPPSPTADEIRETFKMNRNVVNFGGLRPLGDGTVGGRPVDFIATASSDTVRPTEVLRIDSDDRYIMPKVNIVPKEGKSIVEVQGKSMEVGIDSDNEVELDREEIRVSGIKFYDQKFEKEDLPDREIATKNEQLFSSIEFKSKVTVRDYGDVVLE